MSADLRILLADHDLTTRRGIRQTLEGKGFEICAEAADAAAAVRAARAERPRICLIEVKLPGGGLVAAAEISASLPEAEVVMLSESALESDLFDALRAGASGYLLKSMDPNRLPLALEGVIAGEAAVPRKLVASLISDYRRLDRRRRGSGADVRGAGLTKREWQVLDAMREGLSTTEIAEALSISPVTVRRHVSKILKELGVPDRESALRLTGDV
jgi:DNA-binding NarL/FixJ family response regulator